MTGAVAKGTTGMLDEWEITELNDIVEINPESRDPTQNPDQKFSYIDIDSVENGSGVITAVKEITGKDAPSRARRVVRTDDVIMSEVRPYLKAFALVPKKLNNQICSTGFAVLRSKGMIDPKYLLNTLFSDAVIDQCNRMMVGAQYPALNDSQVRKTQIPLPPLPEQRRIAAILTTVDDAIQRSRQATTETERLKDGVMQELMTKGIGHTEFRDDPDVGRVPKKWKVKRLDELIELIDCRHHTPTYIESGYPVVRPQNLKMDRIDFSNCANISRHEFQLMTERHTPKKGDIVYSRNASFGVPAFVETNREFCIGQDMVVMTKLTADTKYIFYVLCSGNIQQQLKQLSGGSTIQRINLKDIHRLLIPEPEVKEQQQIATILTIIDRKLDLQHQRTAHYEHLKQGLMNELLTGERRVKVTAT